ncbi:MAG: kinase [Chloroflexota bacterium]|nr:kinase [Chloroflexota bacterium]
MADVLFVLHARVDPADPHVTAGTRELEARGKSVAVHQRRHEQKPASADDEFGLDPGQLEGVELVVTFGGDGTFLHAAHSAIKVGVPLLGVNLGRLGFLAWIDLDAAPGTMTAWAEGRTEIETRATLQVEYQGVSHVAINEGALLKDPGANVIQLEVLTDGVEAGMFHADGVVVATPTGSTAYAASAGGPILDPRVEAMVLVPLNPHTLATRAVVLPSDKEVELRVDEATRLIVDGAHSLDVASHASLKFCLDGPDLKVVRAPGTADFYQQLREKMRWGEPLVREGRQ